MPRDCSSRQRHCASITVAREALAAMTEGDVLRTQMAALRRLLKVPPVNTVALRRHLAENTVTTGAYLFT